MLLSIFLLILHRLSVIFHMKINLLSKYYINKCLKFKPLCLFRGAKNVSFHDNGLNNA